MLTSTGLAVGEEGGGGGVEQPAVRASVKHREALIEHLSPNSGQFPLLKEPR